MPHVKCACSAVAVAMAMAMIMIVYLVTLSGPLSLTRSISNRFEALSGPRLMMMELPSPFSTRHRATGVRLLEDENGINNKVTFTDAQFAETVEEQFSKIISSQNWLRQRVAWEEHDLQKAPEITFDSGSHDLTVTIFSAPAAFSGSESDLNRQALLSWLHLSPRPHVVLLGNHSSLHQIAEEFPGLVTVEPNIDYSFTGVPLFHSMVARADAVDTNVTVLVQPTVMLLQDFMPSLRKLAGTFTDWALVSQCLEISELPFRFVHKGGGIVFLEHSVTGESMIDRELASFVRSSGKLELQEGVNMWAWTVSVDDPLFVPPMPSFTYGAGYHDQWMARGFAKGSRIVVDATDALVGFHVFDPHGVVGTEGDKTTAPTATLSWSMACKEWQSITNLYLYRKHRNIPAEEKDLLSGGWKLIGCPEPFTIKLCISETHSAANPCHCENIFSRPVSGSRYAETFLEKEARLRLEVVEIPALRTSIPEISSFPSLDQLLPQVADAQKNVVLVGSTCAYKDLLWSFMCRAKALGVTNILVAAFDKSVYDSALLRGLPVFYAGPLPTEKAKVAQPADGPAHESKSDTNCAQQEISTEWKLHVVLQVLQKGFNVLWSGVDVVWFQNPLPRLSTHKAGTLVIESDESDVKLPANSGGRANPGFFYAQAERATIKTFQDLERKARKSSEIPEQLLFTEVLCGRKAQRRVGRTGCTAATGLNTYFLDRRTFCNGIVNGYWWHQNVTQVAARNGVYVLHNNGLNGPEEKARRQKAKVVWFYDDAARMCLHPWQRRYGRHQRPHAGDPSHADTGSV